MNVPLTEIGIREKVEGRKKDQKKGGRVKIKDKDRKKQKEIKESSDYNFSLFKYSHEDKRYSGC